MEKRMETIILGLYRAYVGINGKRAYVGINGKEDGSYNNGVIQGLAFRYNDPEC